MSEEKPTGETSRIGTFWPTMRTAFLLFLVVSLSLVAMPKWFFNAFQRTPNNLHDSSSAEISLVRSPRYNEHRSAYTLLLLRHAKSSWQNMTNLDDFNRPLDAAVGFESARRVGRSLSRQNIAPPQLILASPSLRTRQTLDLVLSNWIHNTSTSSATQVATELDPDLYDLAFGDHGGYFEFIKKRLTHSQYHRVMIVGHNPAMQQLANLILTDSATTNAQLPDSHKQAMKKFPPGAFCEIELSADDWSTIKEGSGELIHFLDPRKLRLYS